VLLGVEGGEHYGLVVGARGVEIDGGGGLGAKVAVAEIEVECADVVGASGAGELHASLDAGDGVMSIHNSSVVFWRENSRHGGGAAKVMGVRSWRSSEVGMGASLRSVGSRGGCPHTGVVATPAESRFLSASLRASSPLCRLCRSGASRNDKRVREKAPCRWRDAIATASEDAGATFPGGCTSLRLDGGGRAGAR
jgi:hypothetical protein